MSSWKDTHTPQGFAEACDWIDELRAVVRAVLEVCSCDYCTSKGLEIMKKAGK